MSTSGSLDRWTKLNLGRSSSSITAADSGKPPNPESTGKYSLWERAKERYLMELGQKGDFDSALETASWDMILSQTITEAQAPNSTRNSALLTMQRLEPSLVNMNNFLTVLAVLCGADPKTAALIWGSIRIILSLALPVAETLQNVLGMLEELSMSLPKFKAYEETLPMNDGLEKALLDVYVEIICFCARTIKFLRSNPKQLMLRKAWPTLDGDFKKTIKRLQHFSHLVEEEAEAAKMRLTMASHAEILSLMQSLKASPPEATSSKAIPCFHVPFALNQRSIKRNDIISQIATILDPDVNQDYSMAGGNSCTSVSHMHTPSMTLKSLALYGTGGVGKTQIALQYSHVARHKFDAVLWISADDNVKMAQDFLAVAQHLKLVPDGNVCDPITAMSVLKSWLADTTSRWLLVFDNADNLEVLKYGWPGGGCAGSILVTTRDRTAEFSPATQGLQVHPFNETDGATAFLSLVGHDSASPHNQFLARQITQELGGLPLALSQMSGYIVQQRLALEKFLPLYKRNKAKIHSRRTGVNDYEHTLGTVWETALSSLSGDAAALQRILAFLDPDIAHEGVLVEAMEKICEKMEEEGDNDVHELGFVADEMDFNDAKEILFRAALIDRSSDTESLSTHRLVQVVVINQLSNAERQKYFNYAICILSEAFPSSWTKATSGYVFEAWEMCEKCLRHVNIVAARWKEYKLAPRDPEKFSELLGRAAWYLYESERYSEAKGLLDVAIQTTDDKSSLGYARSINLYGNCCVDTNLPSTAYTHYSEALRIRETIYGPEHPRTAVSYSNFGMCCTELGGTDPEKLVEGLQHLEKSLQVRMKVDIGMIGNTYSNMASLFLRMGKPDEAEKALASCPSLKDMSDETFLKLDNPRFSSDMFLLSRIRTLQGRRQDAARLGSKALEFRRKRWGNGFKTCASLIHVADLLRADGNSASALKLLEECITIGASLPEAEGYIAQAHYYASRIGKEIGFHRESSDHLDKAIEIKNSLLNMGGRLAHLRDFGNEDARTYEQLVAWMVW